MPNTQDPLHGVNHCGHAEIRPGEVLFQHSDSSNNLFLHRTTSRITSQQTPSG